MKHYTVMDIGGTFIKYGVMNEDFQEVFLEETPTEKLPEPFLAQIIGVTEKCSEYAANNGLTICGIAISMAGFINPVTGENTDFTVSERFRKYNLKKVLNEKTSLPVSVENDSNCAALAEIAIGAGVGCEDVCMMTIGTGIGGAIIHGGKLLRGRNFKAGEFGLTYIGREIVNGKAVYRAPTATSVFVRNASRVLGFEVNGKTVFGYMDNPEVKALYDTWVDDIAMTVGGIS